MKNFMKKCRMVTLQRKERKMIEKDGKVTEQIVSRYFPVRINAGVPADHKMIR